MEKQRTKSGKFIEDINNVVASAINDELNPVSFSRITLAELVRHRSPRVDVILVSYD